MRPQWRQCWRGTVPVERTSGLFSDDLHVWLGPNGRVVNYMIRSGKMMNFVAITRADDWRSESWSVEVDKAEVLKRLSRLEPGDIGFVRKCRPLLQMDVQS